MKPVILHPFMFWLMIFYMVLFSAGFIWVGWILVRKYFYDTLIFIDKSNRWKLIRDRLLDSSTYIHNKKEYLLPDDSSILSSQGRSLFIFSEGKPNPLKIGYNKAAWVSSDSMMSIINNKLIQKLVQLSDKFRDNFLLIGAVGGMIAGISSIVILLKTFGVI